MNMFGLLDSPFPGLFDETNITFPTPGPMAPFGVSATRATVPQHAMAASAPMPLSPPTPVSTPYGKPKDGPSPLQQFANFGNPGMWMQLGGDLMAAGAPSTDPGHGSRALGGALSNFGQNVQGHAMRQRQQQGLNDLIASGGFTDQQTAALRAMGPGQGAMLAAHAAFKPNPKPEMVNMHNPKTGEMRAVVGSPQNIDLMGKSGWVLADNYSQPKAQTPTALERNLQAAGLEPGSPEYAKAMREQLEVGGSNATGPQGNSMPAWATRTLLEGNPSTPYYRAAWDYLSTPRTSYDPATGNMITITPNMSAYRPPAGSAPPPTASTPVAGQGATPGVQVERVGDPKMTDAQSNAAGFADRMLQADEVISGMSMEHITLLNGFKTELPGGNHMLSPEYQMFEQAKRNFVNALLRKESGSAISDHEFESADKQYFPQPGDSAEVIAQKAETRRLAIESMRKAAGPGYSAPAAPEATTNDPLGLLSPPSPRQGIKD